MCKIKAVLFDADGVLTIPGELFSVIYAKEKDFDSSRFENFFRQLYPQARIGKADLKELIAQNQDIWEWDGEIDDLLKIWFETENIQNKELIGLIAKIRAKGTPCYIATNQEKYRGEFMKEKMFKGKFDGIFVSSDFGVEKPDHKFFERVIKEIQKDTPDIKPGEIVYFDDSHGHIDSAKKIGLESYVYKDISHVKQILHSVSV